MGCINAGYYLVRLAHRLDVRTTGSGGTGATNVGRICGRGGFALTLLMDAGKGAAAIWLVHALGGPPALGWAAAVACVAGHVWPAQLQFRGGRGIATWIGAVSTIDPVLALLTVAAGAAWAWPAQRLGWGRVGIGLCALASTPVIAAVLDRGTAAIAAGVALAAISAYAHRPALRRPVTTLQPFPESSNEPR